MKIKIYKDLPTFLCLLTLYWVMFSGFFTYTFGIPESIYYVSDLFIILLMFIEIKKIKNVILGPLKVPALCVAAILVVGFISCVVFGGSTARVVWAIRNWGRFFAYFVICVCVLDRQKVDRVIDFFLEFIHINFVFIIIQFLFLHSFYTQDDLNGFLGRDTSVVNLIYSAIVSILAVAAFSSRRMSKEKTFLIVGEIIVISVLAELKANILLVALFYILGTAVMGKFTAKQILKNLGTIALAFAAVIAAMNMVVYFYPNFKDILTIDGLWELVAGEKGYGNSGYINRLTSISVINKYFFNSQGLFSKLFGLGIGNAEYSKFAQFTSPFYTMYGETFRYLGFSSAALYLEVGLLGVIFFSLFHLNIVIDTYRKVKKGAKCNTFYYCVGYLTAVFACILIIYNNIHRTDASIILAFFLAVPFAIGRTEVCLKEK